MDIITTPEEVYASLLAHAMRDTKPTADEYHTLSVVSGRSVSDLKKVLRSLTLYEFYRTEAQYASWNLNTTKSTQHLREAVDVWKGDKK